MSNFLDDHPKYGIACGFVKDMSGDTWPPDGSLHKNGQERRQDQEKRQWDGWTVR
jgi:hypothetical protein